jgi:hypothetical protein
VFYMDSSGPHGIGYSDWCRVAQWTTRKTQMSY